MPVLKILKIELSEEKVKMRMFTDQYSSTITLTVNQWVLPRQCVQHRRQSPLSMVVLPTPCSRRRQFSASVVSTAGLSQRSYKTRWKERKRKPRRHCSPLRPDGDRWLRVELFFRTSVCLLITQTLALLSEHSLSTTLRLMPLPLLFHFLFLLPLFLSVQPEVPWDCAASCFYPTSCQSVYPGSPLTSMHVCQPMT